MNPKDDNMWCDIHKNKSHNTNNFRLLPDLQAHGYKASENKKIRMRQNIHRSCTCQWQVGVALEMSYFGSRHGKGPADGCTRVVKSMVRMAVMHAKKVTIQNAKQMFDYCKDNFTKDV